ncbi:MAG: type II secretion system GspH family protein [Candidatus Colwellbacteria bacterium]|nr:type II secretion system GspH family protein [Candidatus Colwellbacteria bacterium]
MTKKSTYNNRGFTLMELLVAMTVFLIVVGLSSGVFMQTLRSQRAITSFSENMNNITLALEQIAREVRTGFDFVDDTSADGKRYTELKFRNGNGDYVRYEFFQEDEGPGQIARCKSFQEETCDEFDVITSSSVDIKELVFYIQNDDGENRPPLVTISVETYINKESDSTLTLQTTVSSRILDYLND